MVRPSRAKRLPSTPALLAEQKSLIRQLQQDGLDPVAAGRLCLRLLAPPFKRTSAWIARAIRKSRITVGRWLALLQLPEEIQSLLSQGLLTERHVRPLLRLSDSARQIALARRAAEEGWTVRRLEQELGGTGKAKPPAPDREKIEKSLMNKRAAIERRQGKGAPRPEGDVANARLPANAEEEQALEVLALQGPEPFYTWVYGPNHPITLTIQGKTWRQLGVDNPRAATRQFIETFRLLKPFQPPESN